MKREDVTKIFEGATEEQINQLLNINSADIGNVRKPLSGEGGFKSSKAQPSHKPDYALPLWIYLMHAELLYSILLWENQGFVISTLIPQK